MSQSALSLDSLTSRERPCPTYSDRDVYRFGLAVGIRTLPFAPWEGLKRVILPMEYVRSAEFRYALEHLAVSAEHLVLDIGSPKLLSLFLAARMGARVHATDLVEYFFGPFGAYADCVLGRHRDRYRMETQDARCLAYPSNTFDRVVSVSTVEHIPEDGDSVAMREIARVLKPGGIACLTVPWSDRGYLEEFRPPGDRFTYWATSAGESVFYQRAYDRASLDRRLLAGHGLKVEDVSFWGERKVPAERYLLHWRLPRWLRYALYPVHFPLSRIFLQPLREDEPSYKKVACFTLRKTGP